MSPTFVGVEAGAPAPLEIIGAPAADVCSVCNVSNASIPSGLVLSPSTKALHLVLLVELKLLTI